MIWLVALALAGRASLEQLRKQRAEIESRMTTLRSAVNDAERAIGVHDNFKCLDNPLAPG